MDVIKVFTEEPIGLEALVPDAEADARRREAPPSTLEAMLAGANAPYARAYLAGTRLGETRRVGATAVDDPEAWVQPLLAWVAGREVTALRTDGSSHGLLPAEHATVLRRPDDVQVVAVGPVPLGALAEAAGDGQRRDYLPALRRLLDAGASILFPETAFDGHDWSLFSHAPLRDALADAFRSRPAPGARRFLAPYRRARGEHTFYFEQWALDDLPDWAEEV